MPNLNPKPHGPTIKGTPRAQKQNLDNSHENMEIKKIKNVFIGPAGPTSKATPRAQKENLDKSYENMAIKTIFF